MVKRISMLALAGLAAAAVHAQDTIRIDSVGVTDTRIPIAVPPFAVEDPALLPVARELAETIAYDLDFSGLFILIRPEQYPPTFRALDPDPKNVFRDDWRATKAEHLVYGLVRQEGGQLVGQFRLFDLFAQEQLIGQELRVERAHGRLASHRFSEEIIRQLDGTPGIGTSEIVFSGGAQGKKEIYVADYDGANMTQVTQHGSVSIKPKVSPDGNRIAYLSYKDRYSFLYIYDRRTGKSVPLSREVGLNSAPAWHPDGNQLALTLSKDGNTEIYLRNADGSNLRRITKNRFGDTQPTFSPDGKQIAFVSDRGGNPQIYAMNIDGSSERRLSLQGGSSYDPAWSPNGQFIAYVAERKGEGLEIYVMNADGSNARALTSSSGSNESPSWSADSRHVVFTSTRAGSAELWTATLATGDQRKIARLNTRAEGPSWGPRRR